MFQYTEMKNLNDEKTLGHNLIDNIFPFLGVVK